MKAIKTLAVLVLIGTWHSVLSAQSENILGYETSEKGLTLQVKSGGCTSKESFETHLQEREPMVLSFVRKEEDLCEGHFPFGTLLTWTWEELGIQKNSRVILQNRMVNRFKIFEEDLKKDSTPKTKQASEEAPKITLLGYTTYPDKIRAQVVSKGCTKKENLSASVNDFSLKTLSFHLEDKDLCNVHMPYGETIEWSWAELEILGDVAIGNRVEKLIKVE